MPDRACARIVADATARRRYERTHESGRVKKSKSGRVRTPALAPQGDDEANNLGVGR